MNVYYDLFYYLQSKRKMEDTRSLNCPTLDELNEMVSKEKQEQFTREMRILLEKENNRRRGKR